MTYVSGRQYYAIKESLTTSEKNLIDLYELHWTLKSYVPTIEEVATHLKLKQITVNYYLARKPVQKALTKRGIPWQQHTQEELTATQVAVAVTMMNFMDTRSNDAKLDQLGILPTQYYAWLKDPQFKNLIDTLANENLTNIRPTAIGEFTKLINKGDWNAIKYFLDVTGEVGSTDQPQSEQLIKMIIEILQDEIKDQATLIRIAGRIKLASQNRTLEVVSPQEIEGSVVDYDPELENAKKKLGVM